MIGVENSARPDNCQTKLWVILRQLGLKGLGAWGQVSQILTAASSPTSLRRRHQSVAASFRRAPGFCSTTLYVKIGLASTRTGAQNGKTATEPFENHKNRRRTTRVC